MSRYTAGEIKPLSRATLIAYIERQPEVHFPTKICSRPVKQMEKKHLIRALIGTYGYVKARSLTLSGLTSGPDALGISSTEPEDDVCEMSPASDHAMVDSEPLTPLDSSLDGDETPHPQELSDEEQRSQRFVSLSFSQRHDPEDDVCDTSPVFDHAMVDSEPLTPLDSSMDGGETPYPQELFDEEQRSQRSVSLSFSQRHDPEDDVYDTSPAPDHAMVDLESLTPLDSSMDGGEAPHPQELSDEEQRSQRSVSLSFSQRHDPEDDVYDTSPAPARVPFVKSFLPLNSSDASPTSSPSFASTGDLINWYEMETQPRASDEDLLEEYFRQNAKLAELVSRMKSHKGKHQTDADLIRDYKFALKIFKILVEREWENGRHILSESIIKYLGYSAPWFTKARRVTELLQKIGPDSPHPDPFVLARISSRLTTGKGQDILAFLRARAKAAEL